MRILGWLVVVIVGFPVVATVMQFAAGFWGATMEFFRVPIALGQTGSSLLGLVVWGLLIYWYWQRGRRPAKGAAPQA